MRDCVIFSVIIATLIATTPIEANDNGAETFPGQEILSVALRVSGGFEGDLYLDDEVDRWHGEYMLYYLTACVPGKNILAFKAEDKPRSVEKHDGVMKKNDVRVMHAPYRLVGGTSSDVSKSYSQSLKDNDVLLVTGSGNVGASIPHAAIYHPKDPFWGSDYNNTGYLKSEYKAAKELFKDGYVIMANFTIKKPKTFEKFLNLIPNFKNRKERGVLTETEEGLRKVYENTGEYVRHPHTGGFGTLKEYGFSVFLSDAYVGAGTSVASARIAGFAFYLYQLWDTTEEVVAVMRKTATDIGKPGPDEEFGWGLINGYHPIIIDKAMQRVEESLSFCLLEDVTMEEMIEAVGEGEGFDLLYDIGRGKRKLGLSYDAGRTKIVSAVGSSRSPFGLSSRFLEEKRSSTFQAGLRHALTERFAVVGSYGRGGHDDLTVNQGNVGINYRQLFSETGGISLYIGHRAVWGTIGIPGYEMLEIAQTPFAMHAAEVRASLHWSFN